MKNRWMLLVTFLFVFAVLENASASVVITVGEYGSEAFAIQALNNWRGGSDYELLETFEDFDPEVPVGGAALGNTPTNGQSYYTSFGQTQFYVDGGLPGGGQMRFIDPSNFGVMDRTVAPYDNFGRTRLWEQNSWFATQYLDSGDVSKISLNQGLGDLQLTSLFFFMFDVADIDGKMIVHMGDGTIYAVDGYAAPQENGFITFLGILADQNDYITNITWEMNTDGDGFGLDNFGTLNHVPVPASILLLGTGLLGLVAARLSRARS